MKFLPPSEYQDKNHELFQELRTRILEVLPLARVEHVGASAIPGAYSKGDLDVFVGVSPETFESSIPVIERLGFQEKSDTLRTAELCMLVVADEGSDIAIQLVANGSEFESFIAFREILSHSPELLCRYNQLKLSSQGMDPEGYRHKKSVFIEAVLGEQR